VEGAKTQDSSFPLDILRDMVIASGRASQESAILYTKAMLDLYKSTYRAITPAFNPFEFMQQAGMPGSRDVTHPAAGAEPDQNSGARDEVTNLNERVAELEKLVSSLRAKKTQTGTPGHKSRRQK
jgi:hypothetical protein